MIVHRLECCSSTQAEARRFLSEGAQPPFMVITQNQTTGKGRLDRSWSFEPGRSLAMTVVLNYGGTSYEGLSLVVGLAVMESIGDERVRLKWPNDIMIQENKVGGILVESCSLGTHSQILIGIGLNLWDLENHPFKGLNQNVDSEPMAATISRYILRFKESGFGSFRRSYEERMWKRNEKVLVLADDKNQEVIIRGVNDRGQLVTESHGTFECHWNGEIYAA